MTRAQGGARLSNPVAGSILPGTTTRLQWEKPSDVESVCIRVGTSSSPSANPVQCNSGNSATFTNLPSAGQTVYVTLQSQTANGQISNTYTLYAVEQNTPSVLTSPPASTVVNAGSSIELTWTNGLMQRGMPSWWARRSIRPMSSRRL